MSFYQKIENMLSIMTNLKGFEFEVLNSVLAELCMMFRPSKGVVRFYQGLNFEMQDKGDQFVCYDNGMGGSEVHRIRIVTNINAVVTCTVYMTDDEEPLTPEEFEKVDLVMKIVLSFACRVRLQNVVEMLAFHDDSGFYNLRFFLQIYSSATGKISSAARLRFTSICAIFRWSIRRSARTQAMLSCTITMTV